MHTPPLIPFSKTVVFRHIITNAKARDNSHFHPLTFSTLLCGLAQFNQRKRWTGLTKHVVTFLGRFCNAVSVSLKAAKRSRVQMAKVKDSYFKPE